MSRNILAAKLQRRSKEAAIDGYELASLLCEASIAEAERTDAAGYACFLRAELAQARITSLVCNFIGLTC